MPKILLDAGHYGTANDPGAVANGYQEATLTYELVGLIKPHLERNGWAVTISTGGDVSQRGARAKGHDYALSIHFNAGGGLGAEVMVPMKERGAATANNFKAEIDKIAKNTRSSFARSRNYQDGKFYSRPWKDGVFTTVHNLTDYFGFIRGAWSVGVSADILEVAFIDNKEDITNYIGKKPEFARAIAKAVVNAWNKDFVEESKPTPPPAPVLTPYRVRKSWADASSQVGAYSELENAITKAKETKLNVYDNTGKEVYKYVEPTIEMVTIQKAEYEKLKSDNSNLQNQVVALNNEKVTLNKKIEELTLEISKLNQTIKDMEAEQGSNEEIATLKERVLLLETMIKNYTIAHEALETVV